MKKNLYLSGILLTLLLGTYVFQELRTKQVFEESFTKDHLVLAEDIQSLSWGDVQAIKKDGQWWANDKLLSANTFKQLEKRIGQIKKIKEVVEGYELPYDAIAWNQLNEKMNRTILLKKGIKYI